MAISYTENKEEGTPRVRTNCPRPPKVPAAFSGGRKPPSGSQDSGSRGGT